MTVRIIVSVPARGWNRALPGAEETVTTAARATLRECAAKEERECAAKEERELGIVLADDETLRRLNRDYRGQDRATNVLAFEQAVAAPGDPAAPHFLGDVFIGLGVATREAAEQGKSLTDHLSHLVVHGVLHLCGDDHAAPGLAAAMEARERRILAGLGVADPYEIIEAVPAA